MERKVAVKRSLTVAKHGILRLRLETIIIGKVIRMPEKFKRMVAHIEKQCKQMGMPEDKCQRIAYGSATNYWKNRYGRPPGE